MRRRGWRWFIFLAAAIMPGAAFMATTAYSVTAYAKEKKYKPIRAPMMPGVRQIKNAVLRTLVSASVEDAGGDFLFAVDLASESLSGASNYATALGNGRLSVEISPWAELVVFRWPNPSFSDQLRYYTHSNFIFSVNPRPVRWGEDAPSADWRRYGRPHEPCPELGSRGGLLLANGEVTWLGDPSWTSARRFEPENSTILVTTLQRPEITVEVSDWVDPAQDFMIRSFRVNGAARRFFYHATFAPFLARSTEYTDSDPSHAGFAAVYSAPDDVMIHFQPRVKNRGRLRRLKGEYLSARDLDAAFPEAGVFIAWGFFEEADAYQVGADRCGRLRPPSAPLSGRADAADGDLSGNAVRFGWVDAALSRNLTAGSGGSVAVIIAVSDSAEGAVEMIRQARVAGVESLREKAAAHWEQVAAQIQIPAEADAVTQRVIRRSVMNLLQGQDQDSGAIVASISRQPHYHFDWPRDGAFFDLTLDLAGFPLAVTRHHEFYARTQLTKKLDFAPVFLVNFQMGWYVPDGHWPSNMASDGNYGSMTKLIPFEIDETALLVWDFWRHERVLTEPERPAYIAAMKNTMERAADALLRYVDLRRSWVRPALEDDNFPPEATFHGAASVLTGLASACDAGPRWGMAEEKTEAWCQAARSLREGIRARSEFPEMLNEAGFRGLSWTLWPAPVFTDYREPGARAIKARLAESIRQKINKDRPGFAYLGEEIFVLALADQYDHEYRELLEKGLWLLTHEVAFPGTDCYGEVTLWGDFAGTGEKVAQQRTSIPHLWNGATVYLSALALYKPELFRPMQPPAP